MKLPNGEHAQIDMRKLTEYALSPDSRFGKHKARVFLSVLGIAVEDAELLRDALLEAARDGEAVLGPLDQYGQRYTIDFEMEGPTGRGWVRSGWIIRTDAGVQAHPGEDIPHLTTVYVRK